MWTWALSLEYKTYQAHLLILQIGCPSYNLISCRKSLLIQNSSPQIPSAFNKHEIAKKNQEHMTKNDNNDNNNKNSKKLPFQVQFLIKFTTKLH